MVKKEWSVPVFIFRYVMAETIRDNEVTIFLCIILIRGSVISRGIEWY